MKTLDDDFPPLAQRAEFNPAGLELLRQPFPPHQISRLPKPTKAQTDEVKADFKKGIRCDECGGWHHPKVVHLDYVGHAALTDRLLNADPYWHWEPLAMENGLPVMDSNGGMWIRLTVCGVTRLGYGHAGDKSGGDAIKEVIGDALRNAAMRFGAALELWHKGDLHKPEMKVTEDGEIIEGDDSFKFAESKASEVRALMLKKDIEGAAKTLNTLGTNGDYDPEAKELVCRHLDSTIRSGIKAYDAITQAKTHEGLKLAVKAAPKHSIDMLIPFATKRKNELIAMGLPEPIVEPERAAA